MNSLQHPLEAMVSENNPSTQPEKNCSISSKPKAPEKIEFVDQCDISPNTIDLRNIDRPALLLNSQLKIVWQNTQAIDKIWHNAGAGDKNETEADIFDWMFDPIFKLNVANFSKCIEFFLIQICTIITEDQLREHIDGVDEDRKTVVLAFLDQIDPININESPYSRHLHQTLRSGEMISFEVTATNFNEGRLLVFEKSKTTGHLIQFEQNQSIKKHFEQIRRQPESTKTSFVLLAARLNKATTLRTQMLSDEYRRLINDLCLRCLFKVEQYGGILGKHIESGFFVYFLTDHNRTGDLLPIIECVLEIKELMVDLGREWKIRKDWLHDVELNMGLHWENEYVDIISASTGDVLTSFGDGLQVAGTISQLALDGQIWATKTLIHQLSAASRKQLRFGILRPDSRPRHQPFIRNGFACIKDVFKTNQTNVNFEDGFRLLPVTQIFDLSGSIS